MEKRKGDVVGCRSIKQRSGMLATCGKCGKVWGDGGLWGSVRRGLVGEKAQENLWKEAAVSRAACRNLGVVSRPVVHMATEN